MNNWMETGKGMNELLFNKMRNMGVDYESIYQFYIDRTTDFQRQWMAWPSSQPKWKDELETEVKELRERIATLENSLEVSTNKKKSKKK